ncbi:penicillin acylase family protein [Haloarchaeobius sp. HME9146]|uniref:penicillin acylase family protein n=1 Tax=Haloarchaeobius sp. HME9146 TaxID=2978732 RepID=UPI0021C13D1D|nr:penicillin acylase family protein [Haloarchaeobius sp. HME9146]MCT9096721.1 penicillin acylase family protein [Haloarchaeobius sp. HME9146]
MADTDSHGRGSVLRRDLLRTGTGLAAAAVASKTTLAYGGESSDPTTVTIRRDDYGVPHIYARNADDRTPVFFGFGYAVATDRLFQLELYRRYYHGTVAEVFGEEWVAFDAAARQNTFTETTLPEQLENMDPDNRAILQAFASGINRYIESVREGDREFHKGFVENGFEPEPFTEEDVAGMYVASMAFFSGFQLETLGALVVDILEGQVGEEGAMELFHDLNWGNDPGSPTSSVQPDDAYVPPYTPAGDDAGAGATAAEGTERGVTGEQNQPTNRVTGGDARVPTDARGVHEAEMERVRTLARGLDDLGLPIKYGSNALAVQGDATDSGDAILMGGPQMGFSTPSVMYEAGLHGPDFDVAGITVAGYPFIMFGRNRNGAFTSTAGIDNCIQTFVESIETNDDGPDTYEFRGEEREVYAEEQTIPVAGGEDQTVMLRRTHHGVVTQWNPDAGEAIAQTKSYAGRDMNSWAAFFESQFAESVEEYGEAARQCDYALNFMWAGDDGDIGYFHLGRYPDAESAPWDTRLPADGTQYELTEEDYLRAADGDVPYSINPPRGYSAQWNNKPAPGWNNGDLSYSWGTDHRVQRIINLVEHELDTAGSVGYDDLKDVVYDISFIDLRSIRYRDALLDALADAELTETEQAARDAVADWDHYRQGAGEDFTGEYPVGYTVWNATFPKALENVFADAFGPAYGPASFFLTYRYGRGTLMRVLNPSETEMDLAADYAGDVKQAFVDAFRAACAELEAEYGEDVESWRTSARIDELDNLALFGMPIGVGDAGDMPWVNRGTENHFVRLGDDPVAENVLPPGNSGYVAPDGTESDHYDDQLDMFVDFEYKQLLFEHRDVHRETSTSRVLQLGERGNGGPNDRSKERGGR